MAAEHVGERRNHGDGAVGTKAKRSSHSGAHRDHVGRLGEGRDALDRRDHVKPRMAELLAKAIGPRHYVENELRERRQDTGGEQSTRKFRLTTAYSYL